MGGRGVHFLYSNVYLCFTSHDGHNKVLTLKTVRDAFSCGSRDTIASANLPVDCSSFYRKHFLTKNGCCNISSKPSFPARIMLISILCVVVFPCEVYIYDLSGQVEGTVLQGPFGGSHLECRPGLDINTHVVSSLMSLSATVWQYCEMEKKKKKKSCLH